MTIEVGLPHSIARLTLGLVLATSPLLLVAAHTGTATPSKKPEQPAHIAHIERARAVEVVDDFHDALKRGDTSAALNLLSEDALIFESGGVESNRAEYEVHHLNADAAFSAGISRTPVSRVSTGEGNLASVMSVENVAGTYRGRPINSRSVETMLLRRIDDKWRIVHIHWSSADIKAN